MFFHNTNPFFSAISTIWFWREEVPIFSTFPLRFFCEKIIQGVRELVLQLNQYILTICYILLTTYGWDFLRYKEKQIGAKFKRIIVSNRELFKILVAVSNFAPLLIINLLT